MKYREAQTDCFGKRGLPWHVTVIIRSRDGTMDSETSVHVFEPMTQDSSKVCKQDIPSLEKVHNISDIMLDAIYCSKLFSLPWV